MKLQVLALSCGFLAAPLVLSSPVLAQQNQAPLLRGESFSKRAVDLPEEFAGPFASWANVKTRFGAKGDGIADDTDALQKGLDALLPKTGGSPDSPAVLYLPAGTYRITKRLVMIGKQNVSIIGEHPANTKIIWDGGKNLVADAARNLPGDTMRGSGMIWLNTIGTRIMRLTWDGGGKAGSGVEFKWDNNEDPAQTPSHRMDVVDCVFQNLGVGFDGGGKLGWLDSEVYFSRNKFNNCGVGIGLRHFNSVDYWVWNCEFNDCGLGVSNEPLPLGGGFHVYESLFRRSREADMSIYHTGFYGIRNNVSIGSRRFFYAKRNDDNGAQITLQGNHIYDSLENDPIRLDTVGPLVMMDNVLRGKPGQTASQVTINLPAPSGLLAVGNTFTVQNPIRGGLIPAGNKRLVELDTKIVSPGSLKVEVPRLPGVAPRATGQVFEVAPGSDASAIQAVINRAASAGGKPIVHFRSGTYNIDRTLEVPANVPIKLAGDSWETLLLWTSTDKTAPMMRLRGPSKATLCDLQFAGPVRVVNKEVGPASTAANVSCIELTNADQPGGRVFSHSATLVAEHVGVKVDGLDNLRVELRGFEGGPSIEWEKQEWDEFAAPAPYPAISVKGGPRGRVGQPIAGKVEMFGTNTGRFDVTDGGRLLVRDTWYENGSYGRYAIMRGYGYMTIDNGLVARTSTKARGGRYVFDGFKGSITNVGIQGWDRAQSPLIEYRGDNTGSSALFASSYSNPGATTGALPAPAGVNVGLVLLRENQTTYLPDAGRTDAAFLRKMLATTRSSRPTPFADLPAGVTDVRLFRVRTDRANFGLHILPR